MRFFVLVALCSVVVTAVPKNPQRIVGGSAITVNQYPAITALLYSYLGITNFSQSCGGTIITSRSILTAGHCAYGDAPVRWRVRAGSTYAHSGGVVYTVELIIIHPNYNSRTTDNDVAILRTANRIEYNSVIQPASIAGTTYHLADNQVLWAAGWGTTQVGGSTTEQLRHVQIWSINQAICRGRYATLGRDITENMLCSGWLDVGGRDQCQGDSGGPLYHNGVLVGICSWGYSCATPHYPGVNTRVSRYTPWIQSNA